jgi:transposase
MMIQRSFKVRLYGLSLGKSVMDVGIRRLLLNLHYKELWYDKTVIVPDTWFASSKTCSV